MYKSTIFKMVEFDIDHRRRLVRSVIEYIDGIFVANINMLAGTGNGYLDIKTKISEMSYLKEGFGHKYSVRFFNPSGKNYDDWIKAKDYLRNTFNYIFNENIDVAIFEEDDRIEFEIVSKF